MMGRQDMSLSRSNVTPQGVSEQKQQWRTENGDITSPHEISN